ncbi:MAG: transcriptional repressor [Oscillospiraceae bacterium]|nr:transcriptional repressor [Oscillospiraceae bacterium]
MKPVQKHSKKRDAILQAIRSTDCHPSAEWIYSQVKPIYPDISLGTVYRNLALFEETGEVIAVATVDGQKRYDATADPHTHFICECCKSVIDVETPQPFAEMYTALSREHGFRADHHSLTFYGRCDKCQNGENI